MTETESKYAYFLRDLGYCIKENALNDRTLRDESPDAETRLFYSGKVMAYSEMITWMQESAEAFDISLTDLSIEDIDPDADLL